MKKGLKILSTSLLLSTLVFAGCSCSNDDKKNVSRLENSSDKIVSGLAGETSNYSLQDVYEALIASDIGNKAVADKIVELMASEVLKISESTSEWKTRYETQVKEALTKVADSQTYYVKGEFSEKLFVDTLKADGYNITCPAGVVYGTYDDLKCDYSDYINKNIKVSVLSDLLKEKYIQEVTLEERKNVLTNKKIRDVEYLTISSSLEDSYDDLSVRDFMRGIRDKIANKEVVNFATVEEDFKKELEKIVQDEFDKIGTSKDASQSIAAEYTNNFTQSETVGLESKLEAIADGEYEFKKLISSDSGSSSVISETITSTLLSITDPTNASFARKVVAVTDSDDNTYYYLVNLNATTAVDASDVLLSETGDSSVYTYSIVRFRVINSSTTDATDKYNAIHLLASESTLANNAINHYLKEIKDTISVYDDDVKTYLKTLYPEVFAD